MLDKQDRLHALKTSGAVALISWLIGLIANYSTFSLNDFIFTVVFVFALTYAVMSLFIRFIKKRIQPPMTKWHYNLATVLALPFVALSLLAVSFLAAIFMLNIITTVFTFS